MNIPDNILKQKLQNVYFIWGGSNSGKTTTANELAKRYSFHVYGTYENRNRHFANADPFFQPALCREVHDYWALSPEDANAWESAVIHDFTPMVIADLLSLATQHKGVICICSTPNPQSPGNRIFKYKIPHVVTDETTTIPHMADMIARAMKLEGIDL